MAGMPGAFASGAIPAASNACLSCGGAGGASSFVFMAACFAMTRWTADLLTTALKAGSCVTPPGVAVGLPAAGAGGATGGGVTGFQACWATMYAVVPGVAIGPICGGTGGGPVGAEDAGVAGVGDPDGAAG